MRKSRKKTKHISERNSETSVKSQEAKRAQSGGSGKDEDGAKTEDNSDEDEAVNYPNQPPIQNGFVVFIHQVNFGTAAKEKRRVVDWISDALKMLEITPEVVTVDNLMEQSIAVCSRPKSPVIKFARPVAENDTGTVKSESGRSGAKFSNKSPSRRRVSATRSKGKDIASSSGRSKSPQLPREKSVQSTGSKVLERKSGRPMKPQAMEDKKQEYGVQMNILKDKVRNMQKDNNYSVWVLLVESRRRCIVDMSKLNSLATKCRFKVRWIAAQAPRSLDQSVFSVVNDVVQTKNLCFPEQMRGIRRRDDKDAKVEKPKKSKNTTSKGGKSNAVRVEVLHKTLSKQFNVSSYASFDPNQFMGPPGTAEDDPEMTMPESDEEQARLADYNALLEKIKADVTLQEHEARDGGGLLNSAAKQFKGKPLIDEAMETSLAEELKRLENGIEASARRRLKKVPAGDPMRTDEEIDTRSLLNENQPNIQARSRSLQALQDTQSVANPKLEPSGQSKPLQDVSDNNKVDKNPLKSFNSSDSNSKASSSDEEYENVQKGPNLKSKIRKATVGLALVQSNYHSRMLSGLSYSSTCSTFKKKQIKDTSSWDFNGNTEKCAQSMIVFTRNLHKCRDDLARILNNMLTMEGIRTYTISVTNLLRQSQALELMESLSHFPKYHSTQDLSAGCKRLIQRGISMRLREKASHVIIVDVEDESFVRMWPIFNSSARQGHKCLLFESHPDGTFEENLEKVLQAIRHRMGSQHMTTALPGEDEYNPSFDLLNITPSCISNISDLAKPPQQDTNKSFGVRIKDGKIHSSTVLTVQSIRPILSASITPSGVATISNINNSINDTTTDGPDRILPGVEDLIEFANNVEPQINDYYDLDTLLQTPNMSTNCKDTPPELVGCEKGAAEDHENNCLMSDYNADFPKKLQCEEEGSDKQATDAGGECDTNSKTSSVRSFHSRGSEQRSNTEEGYATWKRTRRKSLGKKVSTTSTTKHNEDRQADANLNPLYTLTGSGEASSSDQDERPTQKNSRDVVRAVAGGVRRSKERVTEDSLLQIHRLGTGGTSSSMPEDDLFRGWVALPRSRESGKMKRSLFVRTQSRLTSFLQRFCTCTRRRRVDRKSELGIDEGSDAIPTRNMTRIHSFH